MKPPFEVICINNDHGAKGVLVVDKIYTVNIVGDTYYELEHTFGDWLQTRFKVKMEHDVEQCIEGLLNEKE